MDDALNGWLILFSVAPQLNLSMDSTSPDYRNSCIDVVGDKWRRPSTGGVADGLELVRESVRTVRAQLSGTDIKGVDALEDLVVSLVNRLDAVETSSQRRAMVLARLRFQSVGWL